MGDKIVFTGNEAVAQGAWEAGVGLGIGYPGTPSTEILESLTKKEGPDVVWAVNEKVALEEGYGAAVGGLRALVTMKHVGLNVAADPLFTAAYLGVNGGLVIACADDPGMHSSQNEQDNRWYALHAKVPMLEPSNSEECVRFTRLAFEISENFDVPVLLRLVTRVSHSRSLVGLHPGVSYRKETKPYQRNTEKYVALPANARLRRKILELNLVSLRQDEVLQELNVMEITNPEIGIITSGASYNYVKEAFGDNYSILKLGLVYPLDTRMLKEFAARVKRVVVIEELDPYLETHIKALGIECEGKKYIPAMYELNPQILARSLEQAELKPLDSSEPALKEPVPDLPKRPPLFCSGCPHRGFFYAANREKITVAGDIGCYTLGAIPPFQAMDTCVCMGGGFTVAAGLSLNLPAGEKVFGVVGDSTFFHSGLTGAAEAIYNKRSVIPVVLDNSITAMTGHQQNPGTGCMLDGEPTFLQEPAKIFEAIGYDRVLQVSAYDLEQIRNAIREAKKATNKVAIIVKGPCRLLKGVQRGPGYAVNLEACTKCKSCLKMGCPAISLSPDGVPAIDPAACFGCGLCEQVCRHKAISTIKQEE